MPLKPDEITVKPEYVGVCGSDVHFFEHGCIGKCQVTYPFVLGHECAGRVVDVGSEVKDFKIGDKVVVEPGIPCGKCEFCKDGRYNLCRSVRFMSTPPFDGVLREKFNFPAFMAYKLPENISTLEGALVEPLAVGMHAVKRGGVQAGQKVMILGAGCIGLMTLLACKAAGAAEIVVSDLFDNRLETALELGATAVFNPKKDGDTDDMRQKFTDGDGFDVVFETAGNKITAAQTGYLVKRGGTIVMVGNIVGDVPYNFRNLYLNEAEIKAVFRYRNVFSTALYEISSGRIDVKKIASDIFDFDKTQEAFMRAMTDKANVVKAVIKM